MVWERLGGSKGVWEHLGGVLELSWGRLGGVLGHLGAVLGASWGVLGSSWGRLVASWARLEASGARFSWDSILDTILYPICKRFGLDFAIVETCEKALRYYENSIFEPSVKFPHKMEKPMKINGFWVLRGSIFASWAALGGV